MKTLYIECNMGAAGDMLMAALLELLPDPDAFISKLNNIGLPGVRVEKEVSVKCGITGTHVSVYVGDSEEESHDISPGHVHEHSHHEHSHHGHSHHEHVHETGQDGYVYQEHTHNQDAHGHTHQEHSHANLEEIQRILRALPIPDKVKEDAIAIYSLIAEAEAKVHGKPVEDIHFHEVGTMDAVADVVGVCMLIDTLAPRKIIVSPVHTGSGQVRCMHGILPVPAPATAHILRGVPAYGGEIQGELCTPTGAAIIRHFADEFGSRPVMVVDKIGYGMGKKDFPVANCVRVFSGETNQQNAGIVEIDCNLDDITGEQLGFALETLLEKGALDVYVIPIQMKKNRPGYKLVCLCRPDDEDRMVRLILQHTTTLGVRCSDRRRHTMERHIETIETKYGDIRIKKASGFGVEKSKLEYDDLARIARENGLSLEDIKEE
ncbi:MAG: nickel pincer cofactor biosynthesis protein LarC [Ruminococcus sp.]|nr:nickel pincer cofactor biosynthesis protein LarC [Ruminococcus sp.]